jgi:type I restriction enzyme S subunit
MSRANTAELVGRSVVVTETPPRLLLNDKTLRVIVPPGMDRHYLNLFNNCSVARSYYSAMASGTSSSMRNLSREQIRQLPVPLPPLAEQRRIVARVDELMALCDRLEARLTAAREKSAHLAASVVHHLTAA